MKGLRIMIKLIDVITKEELGSIITNRSMIFDEMCELAGLEWKTLEEDGVDTDGWYKNGVLYEERGIEIVEE
jgi:hypothetical protein